MTEQEQSGFDAAAKGVKWWENPHESGSTEAGEWDKGHTVWRLSPQFGQFAAALAMQGPAQPDPNEPAIRAAHGLEGASLSEEDCERLGIEF